MTQFIILITYKNILFLNNNYSIRFYFMTITNKSTHFQLVYVISFQGLRYVSYRFVVTYIYYHIYFNILLIIEHIHRANMFTPLIIRVHIIQ